MPAAVSKGRLIPAAILAILVYGMIAAMLGTLLPQLAARFSFTEEQKGTIALAQAIGLIIASVSVGKPAMISAPKTMSGRNCRARLHTSNKS